MVIVHMYSGSANDWFEALNPYLHYSANIRQWFCKEIFLNHKNRLCEFILESPSAEVGVVILLLLLLLLLLLVTQYVC